MSKLDCGVPAISNRIKKKLQSHPIRIPVRGTSIAPAVVPGQKVVLVAKRPADILVGGVVNIV